MTTWKLTGKPDGSGSCEHCGRSLAHRYDVTSDNGSKMIVGRGCLKAVTGWTLTAAQAERQIRMIAIQDRRAANWAAFASNNPVAAKTILADCEAYAAKFNIAHLGGGASDEVKLNIEEGHAWMADRYMASRSSLLWVR